MCAFFILDYVCNFFPRILCVFISDHHSNFYGLCLNLLCRTEAETNKRVWLMLTEKKDWSHFQEFNQVLIVDNTMLTRHIGLYSTSSHFHTSGWEIRAGHPPHAWILPDRTRWTIASCDRSRPCVAQPLSLVGQTRREAATETGGSPWRILWREDPRRAPCRWPEERRT